MVEGTENDEETRLSRMKTASEWTTIAGSGTGLANLLNLAILP